MFTYLKLFIYLKSSLYRKYVEVMSEHQQTRQPARDLISPSHIPGKRWKVKAELQRKKHQVFHQSFSLCSAFIHTHIFLMSCNQMDYNKKVHSLYNIIGNPRHKKLTWRNSLKKGDAPVSSSWLQANTPWIKCLAQVEHLTSAFTAETK